MTAVNVQHACWGKIPHRKRRDAEAALAKTGDGAADLTLVVYRCEFCKRFHVGHAPKRYRSRVRLSNLLDLIDAANGRDSE